MEKANLNTLKRIRTAFHKYTECVYVSGIDAYTREELEDTYTANRKLPLPTFEEMREEVFSKIIEEKFRYIRVAPSDANCAVRIYRKELEIDGKKGGVCGAVCFTKNLFGKWTTIDKSNNVVEMDFSDTYKVEYWTSLITVYDKPVFADYYDIFLRVTKI